MPRNISKNPDDQRPLNVSVTGPITPVLVPVIGSGTFPPLGTSSARRKSGDVNVFEPGLIENPKVGGLVVVNITALAVQAVEPVQKAWSGSEVIVVACAVGTPPQSRAAKAALPSQAAVL
jgi:hypothetical protein